MVRCGRIFAPPNKQKTTPMNKIPNQMVHLKAGVPFPIFVQGGIDCHSEIHFRVSHSAIGKKIDFTFKDADGRTLQVPTKFMDAETVLMYSNDVPNLHTINRKIRIGLDIGS